jgi:xanthine dehydrogenase accessory factor
LVLVIRRQIAFEVLDMQSLDLDVLSDARDWLTGGHRVSLLTVIETFGSAPRPVGSLLAIRGDGRISGSVSGGCVEDDLIVRATQGEPMTRPHRLTYGVTRDEAVRFGLPCGGTLELVAEPLRETSWIDELQRRCAQHELVARQLNMQSGEVTLSTAAHNESLSFDGEVLRSVFGPRWRLLIIGAGQLSLILAQMAAPLGYAVFICDPRDTYAQAWDASLGTYLAGMPDDVVREFNCDQHTAIAALTHDPKLDDMALLEALVSPAFYVGALGSHVNQTKRRERMGMFDLSPEQIERLHGPIGLRIGSRTPAEIAVSILAEITAVKNAGG